MNGAFDPHIAHTPKIASERKFGLTIGLVLGAVALWPLLKGQGVRVWAIVPAVAFVAVAMVAPRALSPLNRLWFGLGVLLGRIVSPVVLGIFFCVILTPIAFLMRAFRKDPLRLDRKPELSSYLVDRSPPGPGVGTLKNQF